MKYIVFTIALVLLLVSLPQVGNSQEIDFEQLLVILNDLQTNVNVMLRLAITAKEGKIVVPIIGEIPFTADQKQMLIQQYLSLKVELQVLYQQLP